MKKMFYLIPSLAVILLSTACSSGSKSVTSSSTFSVKSTVSKASSSSSKLYDTSGNEIKNGSSTVSFKYGNQTTTKSISAAYLIDGVTVNIEEGDYISASSSSDQVVFLVVNGGTLNIKGSSDD